MSELTAAKRRTLAAKLGKESDAALGRKYGLTRQAVWKMRTEADIPAFEAEKMGRPLPVKLSAKEEKRMRKAMKKTAKTNTSRYIRGAVEDKNKTVLDGG